MNRPCIVFDLDGTLIDSIDGLCIAAAHALGSIGKAPPSRGELESYVGDGVERLVHRAMTRSHEGEADEAEFARVFAAFNEKYLASCGEGSVLRAGAVDVLDDLSSSGHAVALLTNKPRRPTHRLLEHLGIVGRFESIVCPEDAGVRKPDPAGLTLAIGGHGSGIMVGDSHVDLETARRAGIPFIGIRGGYNRGRDIASETPQPDAVIDELRGLPSVIASFL